MGSKKKQTIALYALLLCFAFTYLLQQRIIKASLAVKSGFIYRKAIQSFSFIGNAASTLHCSVPYTEEDRIHNMVTVSKDPCRKENCECQRLRRLLHDWPSDKPKAVIYYLTRTAKLESLNLSLKSLDKQFNDKFRYPIIIFHEDELVPNIPNIRMYTNSAIFFQQVKFSIPSFLPRPVPLVVPYSRKGFGYRHMCRFHAKIVYQLPVLWGFDYYMRLDDDSFFLSNVTYDWFKYMRDNDYLYGYKRIQQDLPIVIRGLWKAAKDYIIKKEIKTQFFQKFNHRSMFYNNFEISAASIWQNSNYSEYIDYIDRLGGIYYYRWGDAPIKTTAVTMFVPRQRTHKFDDIAYTHRKLANEKAKKYLETLIVHS